VTEPFFIHFDESGASRMVDVGQKPVTSRLAVAAAVVEMMKSTRDRVQQSGFEKGNVLEVARLAGIMAAKRTDELIPLCHQLPLDSVEIEFAFPPVEELAEKARIEIRGTARVTAKTGVEMEALVAVSTAALTIYDMCKSADRSMIILQLRLEEKSGGQSGTFRRGESAADKEHPSTG